MEQTTATDARILEPGTDFMYSSAADLKRAQEALEMIARLQDQILMLQNELAILQGNDTLPPKRKSSKASTGRRLTEEGRAAIQEAQQKRWTARRAARAGVTVAGPAVVAGSTVYLEGGEQITPTARSQDLEPVG